MKTLLIVDDEREILENIQYDIRDLGIQVITAENGKEALKLIEDKKIDLILTDINMPNLDGMSWIKKIMRIGKNTPYVILSAHLNKDFINLNDIEDKNVVFKARKVLKKPYNVQELKEVLKDGMKLKT